MYPMSYKLVHAVVSSNDSLNMYLSRYILASLMQINGVGIIAKQISPCCLYRIHNMVSDNSEPTCAKLFIL